MEPSATHSVSSALMPDDPSFSSYLRPELNEESKKHPRGIADPDAEISIFDARRYFSDGAENQRKILQGRRTSLVQNLNHQNLSDLSTTPRFSSASPVECYGANYQARSFRATPSTSSEASWKTHTGLLSNPPGANPPSNHQGTKTRPARRLFGIKCPCSDKKSVQVDERAFSEQKTPIRLTNKPKKISWTTPKNPVPIPNPQPEKTLVTVTREWEAKLKQETIKSISSSRPPQNLFPPRTGTGTRTLPSPSRNLLPPEFTFPILSPTKPHTPKPIISSNSPALSLDIYGLPATGDEENGEDSDESSDLFEIESMISTSSSPYPLYQIRRNRDRADEFKNIERPSSFDEQCYTIDHPTQCQMSPSPGGLALVNNATRN